MNPKKTLETYLRAPKATLIVAIICAALCLVCIIGAVVSGANYKAPEAVPFYPDETQAGDYAYIDAVLVSNWLYKTDSVTYYSVMDAENYWYTVVLSDNQFSAMSAQYDYFMNGTDETPVPAAYRLSGLSANVMNEAADALADSWSLQDGDAFRANFGTHYLNATSKPSSDAGGLFTIGALFSGMVALFTALSALPRKRALKKSLARLESLGDLESAAEQLTAPDNIVYAPQQLMLSRDYVYSRTSGAVLRYEDIFWAFMRIQRVYFIKSSETLVAGVPFCGQVNLAVNAPGKKNAGTLEQIMQQLAQRNPQILLGFTRDNITAFNQRQKAEKAAEKNAVR